MVSSGLSGHEMAIQWPEMSPLDMRLSRVGIFSLAILVPGHECTALLEKPAVSPRIRSQDLGKP